MRIRRAALAAALCVFSLTVAAGSSGVAASEGDHLTPTRAIAAPPGFASACKRYGFLCGASTGRRMDEQQLLSLASRINSEVNWSVRSTTDAALYGRAEHWTLPDEGAGDCEDYALLKKKRLVESGVDSRLLSMAVVLDGSGQNHVVLMLRVPSGDVVLDNLRGSILPWSQTGYTFLARQNVASKGSWRVALAGPRAAQIASRTGEQLAAAAASGPAAVASAGVGEPALGVIESVKD